MKKPYLGATGKFPKGMMNKSDEGELAMAIVTDKQGKVILDFGKDISWIGMDPAEAMGLASMLIKHAREGARIQGTAVELKL